MKKYFGKNSKWRPSKAKYVDLTYFWPNFGILLKLTWILQENWTEEKMKPNGILSIHTLVTKNTLMLCFPTVKRN